MTVQDIDNSISSSFDSLELCHIILSNSMDNLVNGQFDNEPYLFPVAGSEDDNLLRSLQEFSLFPPLRARSLMNSCF